jgi:uncharacterized protein (DUF924 family)
MTETEAWRTIYDFWFPPYLHDLDIEAHRRMFDRWFSGGANAEVVPFADRIELANCGQLAHWNASPLGRLSLIIVLDQFPRCLFAGARDAYACDPSALRIAEEGLRNGHYHRLEKPWEKTFFFMPLAHAEGADHRGRLERVVELAEAVASEAPAPLQPLYRHSVQQARGHLEVVARFGRFPHRNAILGRDSTVEETAYLEHGDFVHLRSPPAG